MRLVKELIINSLFLIPVASSFGFDRLSGSIYSEDGSPVAFASIAIEGSQSGAYSLENGMFELEASTSTKAIIIVTSVGYFKYRAQLDTLEGYPNQLRIIMRSSQLQLNQIVVTGSMNQTFVKESPIKVEVLTSSFLAKAPTNNVVEAIQTVNGVQEQVNCGVCGTNDIHINGMEGPYTLMLIDGMPIMSSLASVYGFNGIPTALVDRIEIIKGPSSTLYGTEAVGGVINIITKNPSFAPKFTFNSYLSSHGEWNLDASASININNKTLSTFAVNTYWNQKRLDYNDDNFTDIPLNKRLTIYNKWHFKRKNYEPVSVALRYYAEDRFGGVINWQPINRGSSQIYGESIKTQRLEIIGTYQLPIASKNFDLSYSYTYHSQDSYYGNTNYGAIQSIFFSNLTWKKQFGTHKLLTGLSVRNDNYSDNTPAAIDDNRWIPGIFVQDEWKLNQGSSLLSGFRVDHHRNHGLIFSPRLNFKQKLGQFSSVRLNLGTGFRRVNLFTEDHAALTGSREVIIANELQPERSFNINLNLNHVYFIAESTGTLDLDIFYTYFSNKIVPDYVTNSDFIFYDNLNGYGTTRGVSLSLSQSFIIPFSYSLGLTYQNVFEVEYSSPDGSDTRIPQLFAPIFSGTMVMSYEYHPWQITIDYTSKLMGPQRLPVYAPPNERPEVSPWYYIQNAQMTKQLGDRIDAYIAVKNIGNWTQGSPLIAPEQPFGPDFDTAYAWGPIQPRRLVVGFKLIFD